MQKRVYEYTLPPPPPNYGIGYATVFETGCKPTIVRHSVGLNFENESILTESSRTQPEGLLGVGLVIVQTTSSK